MFSAQLGKAAWLRVCFLRPPCPSPREGLAGCAYKKLVAPHQSFETALSQKQNNEGIET